MGLKTLARPCDVVEIVERLKHLAPDRRPRWGRMSAHQTVCHLSDACRMAMGRKAVTPTTGPFLQTVSKWVCLYVPMRWPRGIQTRPEIEQGLGGTCPVDFEADLAELVTLVEHFASRRRGTVWPTHPIFGRLSEREWLRWGYLHLDHHLRQFGV